MAWLDSSWGYRFKITSAKAKVDAAYPWAMIFDLSNAPGLVEDVTIDQATNEITIAGDHTADVAVGETVELAETLESSGYYIVIAVTLDGGDTVVEVDNIPGFSTDSGMLATRFWMNSRSGVDIRVTTDDGVTEVARGVREFDWANSAGLIYFHAAHASVVRNIIAVSTANDTVTIAGDHTADIAVGDEFFIKDSTDNDGRYIVDSVTESSGDTIIGTVEDITDSTVDGVVRAALGLLTGANTNFYVYYGSDSATDYANNHALGMENVFGPDHVAYWTLGEDSGVAKDETKNTNNGTVTGATRGAVGQVGDAYSFDGINDYVSIAHNTGLNLQTLTMVLWVKRTGAWNTSDNITMFGRGVATGPVQVPYRFYRQAGTTETVYFGPFNSTVSGNLGVQETDGILTTADQWFHYAGTIKDTDAALYRDGALINTRTVGAPANRPVGLFIGAENNRRFFPGVIDDVQLLKRDLSADEIKTIFNNQDDNAAFWTVGAEETR